MTTTPAKRPSAITGPEWVRLAKALKARREELDITQREVTQRAGISYSAYTPIETNMSPYQPSKRQLRRISAALGWTEDSCDLILAGKKPKVAEGVPVPSKTEVGLDAFSVDLVTIRDRDPEAYASLIGMARRIAQGLR